MDNLKTAIYYALVVLTLGLLRLLVYWKPELDCYLKKRRCALYKSEVVMIMTLRAYEMDNLKTAIYYALVVLTLGLLRLLVYWKPELDCYLKKRRCALYKSEVVMIMTLRAYEMDNLKTAIYYALVVLTLGLLRLLVYWKPELECYLKKRRCALYKAENTYSQGSVVPVEKLYLDNLSSGESYNSYHDSPVDHEDTAVLVNEQLASLRHFDHQHIRYLRDPHQRTFNKLEDLSTNTPCVTIHDEYQGLSAKTQAHKLQLHGPNSIATKLKSYWKLFIEEVLNLFYIFQLCSIVLWSLDEYYYYASCIFLIFLISVSVSLYETKREKVFQSQRPLFLIKGMRKSSLLKTTNVTPCSQAPMLSKLATTDKPKYWQLL